MDFAPYQSSPPEHSRVVSPITSPRASVDTSPFHASLTNPGSSARTPPPLQHPQPQRAWNTSGRDLDGYGHTGGSNGGGGGGGWSPFSSFGGLGGSGGGLGGGMFASRQASGIGGAGVNMPGAFPAEISEFDTSLGLRLDYEACLAYLVVPPLGAMLLLVLEKNSDYVRFHAWQSALLFTALMMLHVLFVWSSFFSWIFFLADIFLIAFLTLRAYQDAENLDRYEVPLFGRLASRILDDE